MSEILNVIIIPRMSIKCTEDSDIFLSKNKQSLALSLDAMSRASEFSFQQFAHIDVNVSR